MIVFGILITVSMTIFFPVEHKDKKESLLLLRRVTLTDRIMKMYKQCHLRKSGGIKRRLFLLTTARNTRVRSTLIIEDVCKDHSRPRLALWQMVVEFWGNLLNLWKAGPRDVWEIVMLIMITNIVCKHIKWAVIGISLCNSIRHVVLGDEVASGRMQATSEES